MKKELIFILFIILFSSIYATQSPAEDYKTSTDSSIYIARNYLKNSQPDKSISILFDAIHTTTNADTITLCKILLSEAYRQKLEYNKGKDVNLVSFLLDL